MRVTHRRRPDRHGDLRGDRRPTSPLLPRHHRHRRAARLRLVGAPLDLAGDPGAGSAANRPLTRNTPMTSPITAASTPLANRSAMSADTRPVASRRSARRARGSHEVPGALWPGLSGSPNVSHVSERPPNHQVPTSDTGAARVVDLPPAPEPTHAERCRTLVAGQRRGALSTIAADPAGYPYGSVVTYALDDHGDPLFFVSTMAEHTQNALADPRASLLVTEPVPDGADPLAFGRVSLLGDLAQVDRSRQRRATATSPPTRRRRTTSTSATSRSSAWPCAASATSAATAG